MKKLLAVILALSLVFALAACGGTGGSDDPSEPEDAPADTVSVDEDRPNDLDTQRSLAGEAGFVCGAAFICDIDASVGSLADDRAYYNKLLLLNGVDGSFEYITSIDGEHFASTEGGNELYLIVPVDPAALVTVYSNVSGERGDTLFAGVDGSPILIKCSSDVSVVVEDSYENVAEWTPKKEKSTGKLITGDSVYDLTDYAAIAAE